MCEKLVLLQKVSPFNTLPEAELQRISTSLQAVSIPPTELFYQQHKTKLAGLDIIQDGSFDLFFINGDGEKTKQEKLGPYDVYGAFSILLNKKKSIYTVRVPEPTTVYRLSTSEFKRLCKEHETFYQGLLAIFGKEMLQEDFASLVVSPPMDIETLAYDRYFTKMLDSVPLRPILSCPPDLPVYQVAALMEQERFGCILVKEDDTYLGYVTDLILRNKIIGAQRSTSTTVGEIMEGPIATISSDAYVYEAILQMFQHKYRYLVVEDEGKAIGFISRNKLLTDQAQSPFVFIQSVRLANSVAELKNKWSELPEVIYNLLTRGVKPELVNQIISNISDTIAQKIITEVLEEMGPPPARFVFMALGSEGRNEQTLKTDQDNAIIYEDKPKQQRAEIRAYFLAFAKKVSDRLHEVGFSYCTGNLMAKNPKWTHSLSHWKTNYDRWLSSFDPQEVMNFATFFDCRMVYGDKGLIQDLKSHILDKLADPKEMFFKQLADNALQYEPPLSFFRGIKTITKDDQKVFNIKHAMTPIVDLVRAYALKFKILDTNTGDRLQQLREQAVFSETDYQELMQAYYYLMGLRLRVQAQQIISGQEEATNFVSPASLTKIEKVTLVEIFRVIASFQQRIKVFFGKQLFN